jgi:hypothetical protein
VLPQHGSGRKHERQIRLQRWQKQIVDRHPDALLRGLIHSDGCRVLNRVNGKDYLRYFFNNRSGDILRIFTEACDSISLRWRQNRLDSISIARREDVRRLDRVIGPKC